MNPLHIEIPGPPVPKGRPRAVQRKDGSGGTYMYTPRKTVLYEGAVKFAAMGAMHTWAKDNQRPWPAGEKMSVSVWLFMGDRRVRDIDNCVKAVTDGLNQVVYEDDRQIDELHAIREYDKKNPRAVVVVRVL